MKILDSEKVSMGPACAEGSGDTEAIKGGYIGDYMGTTMGVIKGDTRSLDCSSCSSIEPQ